MDTLETVYFESIDYERGSITVKGTSSHTVLVEIEAPVRVGSLGTTIIIPERVVKDIVEDLTARKNFVYGFTRPQWVRRVVGLIFGVPKPLYLTEFIAGTFFGQEGALHISVCDSESARYEIIRVQLPKDSLDSFIQALVQATN